MRSLFDYKVLTNEVFYRCWHILQYIYEHPNMSDLDREAIKATIMEALVTRGEINPLTQSLDFDNLCIVDNLDGYTYERYPNISGIPLWLKDKLRRKSLKITGGIPITMFLAKPPSKILRYCVYDPNIAVSAVFEDATFYNALYDSPTRVGVRIEEVRPFVEVDIDGELYLVDTLTKRILKSSWFKKRYNFEVVSSHKISEMDTERLSYYKDAIRETKSLAESLHFLTMLPLSKFPELAEREHEIEESKKYFPDEWERYEEIKKEFALFRGDSLKLFRAKEQE